MSIVKFTAFAVTASIHLLAGALAYSQTEGNVADCAPVFRAVWVQFEGRPSEVVDKLTVCVDGKVAASHNFTAPAFGSTPPERTTWRYQAQVDRDLISGLSKVLRRNDISSLQTDVDLGVKGVPSYVLHEKGDTAHFSIFQEKTQRTVTAHNIPGLLCGDRPAQVEDAVWDLICLFRDLYARAKTGSDSRAGGCGCRSVDEMIAAKAPASPDHK
jgi:hypothetical protein